MQTTDPQPDGPRRTIPGTLAGLCIVLALMMIATGCTKSQNAKTSSVERDAALRQIAADYARSGDLPQAQAALEKLWLANPAQLIVSLAESDVSAGRAAGDIELLARLAEALGTRSTKLIAYLAPTPAPSATSAPPTAVPTPILPSVTPAPSLTPTAALTETPPAPTATATPQQPRVVADSDVNLRAGPGRAFPVIGRLATGQEVDILGRNASGDWWRLVWSGAQQAWVAGTVVRVLGPIDTVAVAKDIPTPPPTSTPAPRPTAPPVAANPQPASGSQFKLVGARLWGALENGGSFDGPSFHCGYGRVLHVYVLDAAGNRLNGVTVKSATVPYEERVTGGKDPGIAEFDLGEAKEVYVLRDAEGHEVTSDRKSVTTMVFDIPTDLLIGGGYCKDAQDCAHYVGQCSCCHHYSWDITFQRTY